MVGENSFGSATSPNKWGITVSLARMPKKEYAALLRAHRFWNAKVEKELKRLRFPIYAGGDK